MTSVPDERPRRAVIWTRVSSAKQEDGASLDTQLAECRRFCAKRGWDVVREFRIVHTIAYLDDIPEWKALEGMIRRREIDAFVALKFDRFTGDERDVSTVDRLCERYGVRMEFIQDDVPEGEFAPVIRSILGTAGRKRLQSIKEASHRNQQAKMRGTKSGTPKPLGSQQVPFGLKWTDDRRPDGRLTRERFEVNPDTIDALHDIFRWYDEGASLRELDRRLRARGVRPPNFERTGCPVWNPATLRKVLRNECYVGIGYAGKTDRRKVLTPDGSVKLHIVKPEAEWIALPEGVYPKVVDAALFARCQDRLTQNRRECAPGEERNPTVGLLRRGIGVCAYCGKSLCVVEKKGDAPRYRCFAHNRTKFGCPAYSMNAARLDGQVWDFIDKLAHTPALLAAKLFGQPQPDPTIGVLPVVEAELKRLQAERDRTQRRLRATDDDDLAVAYEQDLKAILAEIRAQEAEVLKLRAQHDAWVAGMERRQGVLAYAARLRDELDGLDWRGRRNVLMRLGVQVKLYRDDNPMGRWGILTRWRPDDGSAAASTVYALAPFPGFGDGARAYIHHDGETGQTWYRTLDGDAEDLTAFAAGMEAAYETGESDKVFTPSSPASTPGPTSTPRSTG